MLVCSLATAFPFLRGGCCADESDESDESLVFAEARVFVEAEARVGLLAGLERA